MLLPSPAAPVADRSARADAPPPLRLLQRWPARGRVAVAEPAPLALRWWRGWWPLWRP